MDYDSSNTTFLKRTPGRDRRIPYRPQDRKKICYDWRPVVLSFLALPDHFGPCYTDFSVGVVSQAVKPRSLVYSTFYLK